MELEWGNLNVIKIICKIRPKGKKGPCPKMLLTPASISKLVKPFGCVTTYLMRKKSADWKVRRNLETMFPKNGGYLVDVDDKCIFVYKIVFYLSNIVFV